MDYRVCQPINQTYMMMPALTALEVKSAIGGCGFDVRIVIRIGTTDRPKVWETDRWSGRQSEK